MTGHRQTGSFYTPASIAKFIIEIVSKKISAKKISVLEPSAGDGIFIKELCLNKNINKKKLHITAVEIVRDEFDLFKNLETPKNIELKSINNDFLDFQKNCEIKFDLIIGNPPYIKRSLLSELQYDLCLEINKDFLKSTLSVKNIWSAFLLSSLDLLSDSGIIAFVLPSEFLQVNYAKPLRELLLEKFQRIEVITFNELLFQACKGQDTVILVAEKKSKNKGLFFYNIQDTTNLDPDIKFVKHDTTSKLKWTSHVLDSDEINLLEKLSSKIPKISDLCDSKTGVVTAANNFFIINDQQATTLEAPSILKKRIIQKSSLLPRGVLLDNDHFEKLIKSEIPCYLLDFNNFKIDGYAKILKYIDDGEKELLHNRYKMRIRNNWFEVPNIGTHSPILFFKRCHSFPRLIKNEANVLATDSAYLVHPKDEIDSNSLIYSFYNSLTLAMSEIQGRYYGGGVLELTPLEFKSLPLPYISISVKDFKKLNDDFNNNIDIHSICKKNDQLILKKYFPELDTLTLEKLNTIRKKLVDRRHRL